MIKMSDFRPSKRQYAIKPLSLISSDVTTGGIELWSVEIRACWFRLRSGAISACVGRLWDIQNHPPESAREFLELLVDGRYGGRCHSRWDGMNFWTTEDKKQGDEDFLFLVEMLKDYGKIPDGWEGWYVFNK